ncbi:LPXTG cell wall anchor domain-containing protein [Saccharothrix sp. NRRL B-16314]|uniref:LPXTG cell wall anchor domain-containing protein n=1 Tax=Saccharothrix sp. NRRL B-16314 TaxID=1463825 RepID=UPI000525E7F1|nr:LPXTG cell wall anchor domain-containing protein [Saccharothrix sp. NRRL B-16314]
MQIARVGAFLGALTAAIAASVFAAAPAQAHTPVFTPGCEGEKSTLTVSLKAYQVNGDKTNTVKVTVDGEEVENRTFGHEFEAVYTRPGDVAHKFTVEVKAWDDPNGDRGWTKKFTPEVPACVKVVPPTTTTTTTTTTTEVTTTAPTTTTVETTVETTPESTTPVTTTTTAEVVPVADTGDDLADTGASIAIPLVIGLVLLGGGAALLIVLRRRAANS